MSIPFLVAAAGTLAAIAATAWLLRRCLQAPRVDMVAWVLALAGLAIGLAAQAAGYHRGFGATTFRAAQLGLALVAPLALAWGMAEVAARGLVARFAARLCLGGLFVVASVILATDVLSDQAFSTDWPLARDHYQFLPLGLLAVVAVVIVITILASLAAVGLRSRHEPGWRPVLLVLGAAAVAALATQGLLVSLPVNSGYAALSVVAVVAGWLAGDRAARVRLAGLRGAAGPPGRGDGQYWPQYGSAGYTGDDSMDLYRDRYAGYADSGAYPGYLGDQYADTGGYAAQGLSGRGYESEGFAAQDFDSREFPAQGDSRGFAVPDDSRGFAAQDDSRGFAVPDDSRGFAAQDDSRGFAARGIDPDAEPVTGAFDALYRDSGPAARSRDAAGGAAAGSLPGEPETGMQLAALSEATPGAGALADPTVDTERLYGQIAIYTLLESGAAEFDRLASTVLEQVRTMEPDTMVFVVHGVPSAPLQRILYQVYRDRAAYDDHQRKPYVTDFDARLRPLVLATNVIELGVREAKVSSLASAPAPAPAPRSPALGSPAPRSPAPRSPAPRPPASRAGRVP
jgi:quinol monooxygenase YgiN